MRESLGEQFTLCTRERQIDLASSIVGSARKAKTLIEKISRIKNCTEELDAQTQVAYEIYEMALSREGLRDFDDLIRIPLELFQTNRVALRFRNVAKYIVVDEYQDISPAQYRLLKCMARADPSNSLWAVGDSDQAIYAFRGADIQNFLDFRNDFPDAAAVVLRENYRSTRTVLKAADRLIRSNSRRVAKELISRREWGSLIRTVSVPDQRDEAEFILHEIERRVGGTSHYRLVGDKRASDFGETSHAFSDFGVLFRTNAQAKALRDAFEEWGIPCQLVGERHAFYKKVLVEKIRAQMDALPENIGPAELLRSLGEETGASPADQGLLQTIAAAYQHLSIREALLSVINELTLLTSADAFDPRADAVALMSLHMAKGLEFRVVFVVGCEEGLIPLAPAKGEPDIEEERRLFYVGMTRAKDELILLHARERFLYGRNLSRKPSPFLAEIPQELVRTEAVPNTPRKPKPHKQQGLF